ncbi:lipocalin family protein [Dyadobacter aurulentus]|uniref:lipocalin family protein n=1 Tax=Dyadobacter sp. UC 10 TaxID=2605428 RepID=UPI0011F112BE|nr:lipocalin family protein [Dyadobacter sp. UC 10]KAA0989532.1 lipocalin family protein [Dyadobacter sp. UC 10]
MTKHTFFFLLFIFFLDCTNDPGLITGNWVTQISDQSTHKQGFTLHDDGQASSINLNAKRYDSWERQDNLLILKGSDEGQAGGSEVIDTLRIISVADSSLVLENHGKRVRYSKTENPSKLITDFETHKCFVYRSAKDSAFLHIELAGQQVTGELFYAFHEKDRNRGTIAGKILGDTLLARYKFMSEGTESIREVAFLKNGPDWVEGFGNVKEQDGITVFKDRSKVSFEKGLAFKGIRCP